MADSPAIRALAAACEDLTYQSETDASWRVFRWHEATGTTAIDEVRQFGRHTARAPATQQSVDEFFGPLAQVQNWYGDEEKRDAAKYRTLWDAVKRSLQEPVVIRIGRRRKTVYVVGSDPAGGWSGLKTTAVET